MVLTPEYIEESLSIHLTRVHSGGTNAEHGAEAGFVEVTRSHSQATVDDYSSHLCKTETVLDDPALVDGEEHPPFWDGITTQIRDMMGNASERCVDKLAMIGTPLE
jgi:hypothetical protein